MHVNYNSLILSIGLLLYGNCQAATYTTGGTLAPEGHWPWIVHILNTSTNKTCGGVLVSPTIVLTAGHCVANSSGGVVGAGSLSLKISGTVWTQITGWWQESYGYIFSRDRLSVFVRPNMRAISATSVIRHPGYVAGGNPAFINDLAIIKLTQMETVEFLPLSFFIPADNSNVAVAGWGKSENDAFLQEVQIQVHKLLSCGAKNSQSLSEENHICGASQGLSGSCQGDSGGPMVANYPLYDALKNMGIADNLVSGFRRPALVGIVSFGVEDCSSDQHPGVYAQARNARDLIRQNGGFVNTNTANLISFFGP